jgi:tetratricopeptide (TPR) repeat protein
MATQGLKELFDAALRAHQSGRLQEAAKLYEHVLNYDRGNLNALSNLGLVLGEMNQNGRAEELLRQAIAQAPGYLNAHINLSVVLHAQQKFEEAIVCCEAALKISPDNKKVLNTLASSLTGAKRYDEAIALLTKITRAHPRYAQGSYYLGTIYAALGKCDEAVSFFNKATELEPRDIASYVAAGECLLIAGRAEESLAQLEKALRLNGYEVRALGLKTLALAELGRKEEEAWLSDPFRLIHTMKLAELGYGPDEVAAFNTRLSAFAANEPTLRQDPPEYATYKGWHSTTNLADYGNEAVEELKNFIGYAFEQRLATLPDEDQNHPLVRSAPRKFGIDLWAVKMLGGGKMLPHIHTDGWLSAVYYVDVPSVIDDPQARQSGWIKFGAPRVDIKLTQEPLTRTVKPEPGLMVTFPSYLWHDTVPLPADNTEQRLCLSFDLLPLRS